jgi:hypothetical protein
MKQQLQDTTEPDLFGQLPSSSVASGPSLTLQPTSSILSSPLVGPPQTRTRTQQRGLFTATQPTSTTMPSIPLQPGPSSGVFSQMFGLASRAFTPSSKLSNLQTPTTIQQTSSASAFPVTTASITNPTFSAVNCTSISTAPTSQNQSISVTASQTVSSNAAPHPTSAPIFNPTSAPVSNPTSIPVSNPTSIPFTLPKSIPLTLQTSIPFVGTTSNPFTMPTSIPFTNPISVPVSNPISFPQSNPTSIPFSTAKLIPSTTSSNSTSNQIPHVLPVSSRHQFGPFTTMPTSSHVNASSGLVFSNPSSVAGPPHSIPAFPAFPHGPALPSTTTQQPST